MTDTDKPQGDQEDRWGRMKRQNVELRAALEDLIIVADPWCISPSCEEPISRARNLLSQEVPK